MSSTQPQEHPSHTEAKRILSAMIATNRWNNISSDEDESESDHSEKQQIKSEVVQQQEAVQQQKESKEVKEDNRKKQANVVPFDAKKKFRGGDFAHLKTVKGGFKAQKLEKKKFHLDTVKNPFAFGNQESSESETEQQDETAPTIPEPPQEQPSQQVETSQKKAKKTKKQQEKEELDALLKQLGAQNEDAPKQEGEKKKKKKKVKKAEEEVKEQQKPQNVNAQESKPAEQFTVNKQTLEELMRKKAEASKTTNKKSGKASIANAAKKAIEEREAKNKAKKVYVDL